MFVCDFEQGGNAMTPGEEGHTAVEYRECSRVESEIQQERCATRDRIMAHVQADSRDKKDWQVPEVVPRDLSTDSATVLRSKFGFFLLTAYTVVGTLTVARPYSLTTTTRCRGERSQRPPFETLVLTVFSNDTVSDAQICDFFIQQSRVVGSSEHASADPTTSSVFAFVSLVQ